MNIEPVLSTMKNPPERFTGDVWLDPIAAPHDADQRMTVATVRFAPGARTAWHSHARGQYLRVTQGTALCGTRDGHVVAAHPGQTIYTPPGEEHWHGATRRNAGWSTSPCSKRGDDPATSTTWLEHVADPDYARAAQVIRVTGGAE